MLVARLIPCLLLRGGACVKTLRFGQATYLGDPINIVKILNEREVDELILLDIDASRERRGPRFDVLADLASECFMPLCYGGGIRSLDEMRRLFQIGFEKAALCTEAVLNPALVAAAAREFGSQSVVGSIDVKRDLFRRRRVATHGSRQVHALDPVAHARGLERLGVGELFLTSGDRDGTMEGYDLELIHAVASATRIPVVASGGAGRLEDVAQALRAGAAAGAAGSLFAFAGRSRAVLVNYPDREEIDALLGTEGQ